MLVRLLTGEPSPDFDYCVSRLTQLVRDHGAEVFASNQVIGEAYIAVQHHYGVSKADARAGLVDVLRSGLVAPLNGRSVFAALEASDSPGLEVLTLTKRWPACLVRGACEAKIAVP